MVSDRQVVKMKKLRTGGAKLQVAALKAGMSERTARKYMESGSVPSDGMKEHVWRTRSDPFVEVWEEVRGQLDLFPSLEAKTLLEWLQDKYPGQFSDGQLRTLQRRTKVWRASEGPGREVFFAQEHHPGVLCESDFTDMSGLGVTIQRERFDHLAYHFVLTYSNWETGSVCFSESYASLSYGLQGALWKLGGVPREHRTDRLSAAVNNLKDPEEFTERYERLLRHYGMGGQKTGAGRANENGDVEQRHRRLKNSVDQWLMLRGSREFESREAYERFLAEMFEQLNRGRQERLREELKELRALPARRLEDCQRLRVRVGTGSTIAVLRNVYSVHSRLIGEQVEVRVRADHLEVWYGQRCVDRLPRLRGAGKHRIDYRHIIEWLVKKPGAFADYRYRSDLFPTTRFRVAYDLLKQQSPAGGDKEYLKILYLAARESESGVDQALEELIEAGWVMSAQAVEDLMGIMREAPKVRDPEIEPVNLGIYDELLGDKEVAQ